MRTECNRYITSYKVPEDIKLKKFNPPKDVEVENFPPQVYIIAYAVYHIVPSSTVSTPVETC